MPDDRPTLFEIDGRDLAGYVARHKAGEFYIYAADAGSNDGITRKNAHYTLHVRYPTEQQVELLKP